MTALSPKSVLITGATGAIGSALAEAYAAPGVTLHLQGRNAELLTTVAEHCRARGARVTARILDVTEIQTLFAWIGEVDAESPVDLIFANAGMNTNVGPEGDGETWQATDMLIDINIRATMALVHAILPGMRRRGRGQIVLISSLAAYYGLPLTPSYSASKAALKAYGEALRGWLAPEGILVNVVMPGYVESQMCRDMPGPKPFLWSPQRAARTICRGLKANRPRISFPFPLNLGCWLLSVIHPSISQRILALLDYRA